MRIQKTKIIQLVIPMMEMAITNLQMLNTQATHRSKTRRAMLRIALMLMSLIVSNCTQPLSYCQQFKSLFLLLSLENTATQRQRKGQGKTTM